MYETEIKEIAEQARQRATAVLMLTSGEPDIAEPQHLGDLDSFSVVQLILALEDHYQVPLLEEMPTFEGRTFEDLAEFVVLRIARQEESGETLPAPDAPAAPGTPSAARPDQVAAEA